MQQRYAVIAVATLIFYLVAYRSAMLEQIDNRLFDLYKSAADLIAPPTLGEHGVLIVEIDDKSLAQLGQWPWPRVLTAKLLEQIGTYRPSAIAADLIFPENDRTSPKEMVRFYDAFFGIQARVEGIPGWLYDNDVLLADTIGSLPFLLPVYLQNRPGAACIDTLPYRIDTTGVDTLYTGTGLLCNIPSLQQQARSTGFINAREDRDGIFRRMPLVMQFQEQPVAALALATLLVSGRYPERVTLRENAWGVETRVGDRGFYTDAHANALLNFYPPTEYRHISAVDLMTGKADPADIRGKFVLLGATAVGLHDRYNLANGETFPGIYMHATFIENFLNGDLISQPGIFPLANTLLSLLGALLTLWLLRHKRYASIVALFIAVTLFYSAAAVIGLLKGLYIAPGYFIAPFSVNFTAAALALAVIGYNQRKQFYERLSQSHQATLDSMVLVAETRDMETGAHIIRTKNYVKILALALSQKDPYRRTIDDSFIEQLFHAAPLHDVGKVGIPDYILKKPDKLTFEEFETMKLHTRYGKEILDNAISSYQDNAILRIARNIAYHHHEKWDGSGYPLGLSGSAIPIEARMMALADVYDALISRRCYKEAFSFEDAEAIIMEGRGTHFDPELIDIFAELRGEFRHIAALHR